MNQSATITAKVCDYKARSNLRESSEANLDRAARWFIELHGDLPVAAVGYGHCDDYRSWLLKPRGGRAVSRATANSYLAIFKPFWSWLRDRGFIAADPFGGVHLYTAERKIFPGYERQHVVRMLRIATPIWRRIIALALCGMRQAEILNLTLGECQFEHNRILLAPKGDTPATWRWGIKDRDMGFVGFDESVAKLLIAAGEQLTDGQPYLNLKLKYWRRNIGRRDAGTLTHRLRNCPWGNFTRDFHALQRRAAVPPRRFHDLRHLFATERYEAGCKLPEIQYLLRHSSIQTTARYVKLMQEEELIVKSSRIYAKHYATLVP